MRRVVIASLVVVAGSGCFDLDSFVWNPTHCSKNTDETCTDKELCTPCGEPLPFAKWGVPQELVTQHPIALDDGETNDSWFVRAEDAGGDLADVTVVYSHGNFGGIEHYLNRVALVWQAGVNVYAVDYRGFGQSSTEREPSEAQFMSDTARTRAVAEEVLAGHGVSTTAIVLMGYSAGAASAVEMGVTADSCGIVLEAPFPSIQAFTDDSTFIGVPGSFVATGQYDNIFKMSQYEKPYLHFHGSEDKTVRIELGERMFAGAPSTKKEFVRVDGAEHGNYLGKEGELKDVPATLGEDVYIQKIASFIDALDCN